MIKTELINLLSRVGVLKRKPDRHIVLIYICNPEIHKYFRKNSGIAAYSLRSPVIQHRIAHKDFLPNNLLSHLKSHGKIRLTEIPLQSKEYYSEKDFSGIPSADIWVFALMNYPSLPAFKEELFEYILGEANVKAARVLNLTSYVRQGNRRLGEQERLFPIIAKHTGNSLTTSRDSKSIVILENDVDYEAWERHANKVKPTQYVLEKFRVHHRNQHIVPLLCIERWIYICGDLTVGFRISTKKIIRQSNSLTSYWRDSRLLENEYQQLRKWMRTYRRPTDYGSMPLSFSYTGEPSFWDIRHETANQFVSMNSLDICSMDVIEDSERNLHIIDSNEHSWESAGEELMFLWSNALWKGMEAAMQ